jgi:WD40 repeat protein
LSRKDREWAIPIATDEIRSIAFHADGRRVACAIQDGTIEIWDIVERSRVVSLAGAEPLVSIAWSNDGLWVAASGLGGGLWVRDARSLEPVRTIGAEILGRSDWIEFDPSGERLAIAGRDGVVQLLDWRSGEFRWRHRLHRIANAARFSPDGQLLASSGEDHTVRLIDVESGKLLSTWRGDDIYAGRIAFSPDGLSLVTSGWNASESSLGTQKRVLSTGELLWSTPANAGRPTFAPDESRLFVLETGGLLGVYDPATGDRIVALAPLRGSSPSTGFAASPDGRVVATGTTDGRLVIRDARPWR